MNFGPVDDLTDDFGNMTTRDMKIDLDDDPIEPYEFLSNAERQLKHLDGGQEDISDSDYMLDDGDDDEDEDEGATMDAGEIAGTVIGALVGVLGGAYAIYHYHGQYSSEKQVKVSPPEDTKGLSAVVPA